MKRILRLRQSLAVVAVTALPACYAAQNVSLSVGVGSNSHLGATRVIVNHGGKLAAAYSGSYSTSGDCSATAMLIYKGTGNATFLHSSSEQVKLTWYCGSRDVTGSATLTSIQVPGDSVSASVSTTDFKAPCDGFTMSFTVTGGTGRFRRASGSGTIALKRLSSKCSSYSYNDKWKGALKF